MRAVSSRGATTLRCVAALPHAYAHHRSSGLSSTRGILHGANRTTAVRTAARTYQASVQHSSRRSSVQASASEEQEYDVDERIPVTVSAVDQELAVQLWSVLLPSLMQTYTWASRGGELLPNLRQVDRLEPVGSVPELYFPLLPHLTISVQNQHTPSPGIISNCQLLTSDCATFLHTTAHQSFEMSPFCFGCETSWIQGIKWLPLVLGSGFAIQLSHQAGPSKLHTFDPAAGLHTPPTLVVVHSQPRIFFRLSPGSWVRGRLPC